MHITTNNLARVQVQRGWWLKNKTKTFFPLANTENYFLWTLVTCNKLFNPTSSLKQAHPWLPTTDADLVYILVYLSLFRSDLIYTAANVNASSPKIMWKKYIKTWTAFNIVTRHRKSNLTSSLHWRTHFRHQHPLTAFLNSGQLK